MVLFFIPGDFLFSGIFCIFAASMNKNQTINQFFTQQSLDVMLENIKTDIMQYISGPGCEDIVVKADDNQEAMVIWNEIQQPAMKVYGLIAEHKGKLTFKEFKDNGRKNVQGNSEL